MGYADPRDPPPPRRLVGLDTSPGLRAAVARGPPRIQCAHRATQRPGPVSARLPAPERPVAPVQDLAVAPILLLRVRMSESPAAFPYVTHLNVLFDPLERID